MTAKRKLLGLSRRQLAGLLSVSKAYVGMIEAGIRTPGLPLAMKMSELLSVDLVDLFPDLAGTQRSGADVR